MSLCLLALNRKDLSREICRGICMQSWICIWSIEGWLHHGYQWKVQQFFVEENVPSTKLSWERRHWRCIYQKKVFLIGTILHVFYWFN